MLWLVFWAVLSYYRYMIERLKEKAISLLSCGVGGINKKHSVIRVFLRFYLERLKIKATHVGTLFDIP
jgi:hypothetical protein